MLLDSNLIIYSAQSEYRFLKEFFRHHAGELYASEKSYVEVIGFHNHTPGDVAQFETFFTSIAFLSVSTSIIHRAAALRQQRRMSLGDSIIAATALQCGMPLATRNTSDFDWIPGLSLVNPIDKP